jgi:hypothetical protein
MKLELVSQLWEIVKPSIISTDRIEVSEAVVSMLIDHNCGVDDIREAFRGDYDIIESLKYYADEEWNDEEQDEELNLDDEDDDDEW